MTSPDSFISAAQAFQRECAKQTRIGAAGKVSAREADYYIEGLLRRLQRLLDERGDAQ